MPVSLGTDRLLASGQLALAAPLQGGEAPVGGDLEQPGADEAAVIEAVDIAPCAHQGLLQRVLGGIEVLAPPDEAREHPRDEGAQHALVQPAGRVVGHGSQSSEGVPDMISRTSIHSYRGAPPGPGSEET